MNFNPKALVVALSVAALLGGGMSYFTDLGFWPAFAMSIFAILINGLIATVEDEAPGGFNNPDNEKERKRRKK
jgi:hypothetical protein